VIESPIGKIRTGSAARAAAPPAAIIKPKTITHTNGIGQHAGFVVIIE
jgi:hypothetical protein